MKVKSEGSIKKSKVKAGLEIKAGDLIIKIKDEAKEVAKETAGMSLPEAVTLIRGEKGTPVTLTLKREGVKEPFDVEIVRGTIIVKSVEVEIKNVKCQMSNVKKYSC